MNNKLQTKEDLLKHAMEVKDLYPGRSARFAALAQAMATAEMVQKLDRIENELTDLQNAIAGLDSSVYALAGVIHER